VTGDDDQWHAVRDRPEYKAGIWFLRLTLLFAVLALCAPAAGIDMLPGAVRWGYVTVWTAALVTAYVLLNRAGVRLLDSWDPDAIPRRQVYKDVLWLDGGPQRGTGDGRRS
jgi:hypothetical protein